MKRRQFLTAIPTAAVAGCLGSQPSSSQNDGAQTTREPTTMADSEEPTVRTTSTNWHSRTELSFGEWYEGTDQALRVDDVNVSRTYRLEGESKTLPEGKKLVLVEYTQKNIAQHKIGEGLIYNFDLLLPDGTQEATSTVRGENSAIIPLTENANGDIPGYNEYLQSGETGSFVCGAIVPAESVERAPPVGYFHVSGAEYNGLWRPE